MNVLDLFSGIGGISLGLERARLPDDCVLRKGALVPQGAAEALAEGSDSKERDEDWRSADVVVGGFPCQDISSAGKRAGISGRNSGLWRYLCGAIRMVRPRYAIVENVADLLNRGMGTVLGDLAEVGYDTEWHCIPATAVGADHFRDRAWIVAHTQGFIGWGERGRQRGEIEGSGKRNLCPLSDQPEPLRMVNGVPHRVDRLKALGNAVVPRMAEIIGRSILEHEEETK